MAEDESAPPKYYYTVSSLEELVLNDETKSAVFPIKEVLDQAFQLIQLCINNDYRKLFFKKQKPSPIVKAKLNAFNADTFALLKINRPFLTDLLTPLFWLIHYTINKCDPSQNPQAEDENDNDSNNSKNHNGNNKYNEDDDSDDDDDSDSDSDDEDNENNKETVDQETAEKLKKLKAENNLEYCKKKAEELQVEVGTAWGRFLFPFETNNSLSSSLRDAFVNCIPYFYTQTIQHLFILLLDGSPPTAFRPFRMKICATLVKIFTQIEPLESLLLINLGFYFKTSPQVDLSSSSEPEKQKFEEPSTTFLPEENLDTLIEMPHRKRPINKSWNISGISNLVSESTHRKSVPYEHNSKIVIQYPKDGEKDWTNELPPLLPEQKSPAALYKKDSYDPNKETRSLLYRSRRPEIIFDYNKMKKEFAQKTIQRQKEINDKKYEFAAIEKKIRKKPLIVLKKFTDDLRTLQLERKWNETPELYKKKEVERMEEERKRKLEKERLEEEQERRERRRRLRKEREEEELRRELKEGSDEEKEKEKEGEKKEENETAEISEQQTHSFSLSNIGHI
ncbi:hypothetical protein TRFO_12261 [Tritrichomonas foetus]|uniref:Uncharacterized protein n=1 Tax=Tritrichomonas foetus TaxID=1144522 RepID=A0A1J4J5G8_9EUKA|nr:hypothetical protein TRFO_12261 [Tritrichomonas foetus]|eukprot:OHS92883.1 hypothetical protein TRFO_12261 [Tritrichomonas foetus]